MSVCPTDFIRERKYLHNVSPASIVWYEQSFKRFEGALDSRAAVITRIAELRERLSAVSVNVHLRCINAYFMWLHKEHGKELLRIPKLKEEQKILATLTPEGIQRTIGFKPIGTNLRRAHLIALTILDTGLRASECLGVTTVDVDFDHLTLKILGKGGKHRMVPFSGELRKKLWRYAQQRHVTLPILVFGTKNNTQVSVRNLERDFKMLGQKIGIEGVRFSPHTLRHSFAVQYLKNGGNLEYLRRILGHTSLSTTQKYLRSLGVEDLGAVHSSLSPLSARR